MYQAMFCSNMTQKNLLLTFIFRNGFIKIALQTGASLVPVYAFGENDAYEQLDNKPGTVLRWIQDTAKKVRFE
jgi:1-acyl-sn-glycerol-3-phosphate acyltransferase